MNRETELGIGNWVKSLLGGSSDSKSEPAEVAGESIDYNGFKIEPMPIKEGGQYRTAGYISGELDGEVKRIRFIRADNSSDQQAAIDHSLAKGKQIIDEQGQGLLSREHL